MSPGEPEKRWDSKNHLKNKENVGSLEIFFKNIENMIFFLFLSFVHSKNAGLVIEGYLYDQKMIVVMAPKLCI